MVAARFLSTEKSCQGKSCLQSKLLNYKEIKNLPVCVYIKDTWVNVRLWTEIGIYRRLVLYTNSPAPEQEGGFL